MHVDLVEALRCPRGHGDGWLVASAAQKHQRRITSGVIGCPECGAEWAVVDSMVDMTSGNAPGVPGSTAATAALGAPRAETATVETRTVYDPTALVMRLAALLDLREARGAIVLTGEFAGAADAIAALAGVIILAVNPPDGVALNHSRLRVAHAFPLGVGTVRGIVLDAAHATPAWLDSAVRAVEKGGRIVAPANSPVPVEVKELARDEQQWVAEVQVAASGLVPLRRSGDPMAQ